MALNPNPAPGEILILLSYLAEESFSLHGRTDVHQQRRAVGVGGVGQHKRLVGEAVHV